MTVVRPLLSTLFASTFAVFAIAGGAFAKDGDKPKLLPGKSLAGNYLAARIAGTDRDLESAAAFYRQAILLDPENVDIKQRAFQTFVSNGDFEEAVELGRELGKIDAAAEIARIVLAVNDMRSKSWTGAQRQLEHNWRSAIDRLVAGLMLAWSQVGEGKVEKALATADGLTGPAWFDLFVQYHSGLIALQGAEPAEGIARLEKAFANKAGGQGSNYTYMRAIQSLAQAYWKSGDKERAKAMVLQAKRIQPQNPVFDAMLALIESGKGLASPIAKAQRGASEVFLNLGTALNKDGGEQFARIYLQLANMLAPDDDAVTMQLADLYDQQGLPTPANDLFATVVPSSPFYRIAQLEIAINLDAGDNLDAAREIFDTLVASDPDDITAHLSYSAVLSRHEMFDQSIPVLERLVARIAEPRRFHWSVFYRLGIAYERTKQWDKAEKIFYKALDLYPDQPSVLNYLGYSWVDMNINLEEGLELIRKAVEIRPNDGYMVDSLGWAYYKLGRFEEAVADLERAVELRPADPTINDHLGDAYWMTGRKLEATFQWRHALSLDPLKEDIPKIEAKLENGLNNDMPKTVEDPDAKPDNG